jgi:hypothetical protein
MKAIILCDDCEFAARTNGALRYAGHRSDASVQWTVKDYPMNALHDLAIADKALAEAADAHLIVIAGRQIVSLPLPLQDWLERWAGLRQIEDAVLAVIHDAAAGAMKSAGSELSRFIRKHGLSLITEKGADEVNLSRLPGYFSWERELRVAVRQTVVVSAVTRDSFRSFGINE